MSEVAFVRVLIVLFDLAGAVAFGIVTVFTLAFVSWGNSAVAIVLPIFTAAFAALGVGLAFGVVCKRGSIGWTTGGVIYMVVAEGPLLLLMNIWELEIKTWFFLLILPVLGCLAHWWLIELQQLKTRQDAGNQARSIANDNNDSSPNAAYSSSS